MPLTDFSIVTRSMTSRKFSTVTTVLTVAVAVALMLVLLAMQRAGKRAFERGSGDMHLLVSRESSPLVSILNGVFYANPPQRPMTWAQFERFSTDPRYAYTVPTQYGDSYRGLPVLATSRAFFTSFKPNLGEAWELSAGRFFDGPFEVVVGAAAARTGNVKVGDTVYLTHGAPQSRDLGSGGGPAPHVHTDFAYTIVGILKPTGGSHDRALFTDLESSWVIHAADDLKRADNAGAPTEQAARRILRDQAMLFASAGGRANPTAEDLKAVFAAARAGERPAVDAVKPYQLITGIYLRLVTREGSDTPANLPQIYEQLRREGQFTVAQPAQEIDRLFLIVGNVNQLLVAVAAVVMVSSAIAVMLALYNSMEQRRRQIAVLRVLGASRKRIFGLVVTESAMIGLLGAAAGILLSVIGGFVVAGVLRDRLGVVVEPTLPPREMVIVMLVTLGLAIVAGFAPAALAYNTSVAKNLRPLG